MEPTHDMAAEIRQNPDSVWDTLPRELKVMVLGHLTPADWNNTWKVNRDTRAATDEAEEDLATKKWVDYHVTIIEERIAVLRSLMDMNPQDARGQAPGAFAALMAAYQDISDETGVPTDRWTTWTHTRHYSRIHQLFQGSMDISGWYRDHFD